MEPSPVTTCKKWPLGGLEIDVLYLSSILQKSEITPFPLKIWQPQMSDVLPILEIFQDISPLANLPLLEYKLCMPSVVDRVHHSNCFKLVYSTHEYFFRTSGSYSFQRYVAYQIRWLVWDRCAKDAG